MDKKNIQKGFNHGYIVQKYEPKLGEILSSGIPVKSQPYVQGLVSGIKERKKEIDRQLKQQKLKELRDQNKSEKQEKGFDRTVG